MKRFWHITGIVAGCITGVLLIVFCLLASDRAETRLAQIAVHQLARKAGTTMHVGSVSLRFPARVTLRDIYIEDRRQDTLAYIGELYAHLSPLALTQSKLHLRHVRVRDGVANIYREDETGEWNYRFLAEAFKREDEEATSIPLEDISVKDVRIDNLRMRYEEMHGVLEHARMDLHELSDYALDAQIGGLAGRISKGEEGQPAFIVEDMQAHAILTDSTLTIPTLLARLPHSKLDMSGGELRFPQGDTLYLSRSAHEILISLGIREAELVPSDLTFFVPQLRGMRRPVTFTGSLDGTLDSLYFDELAVHYDGKKLLEGSVSIFGLPDVNNPYIRANLREFHTNASQIQDILSQLQNKPMRLPQEVHRLGNIRYRGLASGRLHDMTLHGAFHTTLGSIVTDGSLRSDTTFEHLFYDAQLVSERFMLGRMLAMDKLGTATLDFSSKGRFDDKKARGDVNVYVRELRYNDYTFNDLHANGQFEPKRYNGSMSIHDPHIDLSFDGVIDTHDVNPEINFNLLCRHFDSAPLGIEKIGSNLKTRFSMAVDMNGAKPDDMSGYMVIDSLFIATANDSVLTRQIMLLASAEEGENKTISLQTDNLTAQMDGTFRYEDLVPSMQAMIHHYLPTAVAAPQKIWNPVDFSLRADGGRIRDVQRLFTAPVTLSDHTTLRASGSIAQGKEPSVTLRFAAPGVRAGNTPVHDLTVTLNTVDTLRHTGVTGSGLAMSVSAEAMQMHTVFSTLAFRDTLLTHLTLRQEAQMDEMLPEGWRDLTPRELQRALSDDLTFVQKQKALLSAQRAGNYGGDIHCITHFEEYQERPLVNMHFLPGTLLLRDSVYTLGESNLRYCAADTAIEVQHFSFEGGGQHIRANGIASRNRTDTLSVDMQRLDASYIVPFVLPVQTIMFNGLLTGEAQVSSVFRQPLVETQIHIDSMGLNNCWFGDAEVDLHILPERRHEETTLPPQLQFHAEVDRPTRHVVSLDGEAFFDGSGRWKLDMMADSVPLAFVNHWTSTVLTNLDGNATGHVVVGGRKNLTYVLLRAAAQNASLTLPWTGVRYTIPHDTIVMDTTAILFPNVHLTDAEGNKVEVNGGIHHNQFGKFKLDLHVDAHDALVFGSEKTGEMIQGNVYATGHVDVTGDENDLLVAADAITSRNSRFRLSLDNTSSAYESNFIHFVEHPDTTAAAREGETDLDNIDIAVTTKRDSTEFRRAGRCMVKLNLDVTPYLLFQLILGERNGDIIQARGSGALRLTYDTETGDVSLLGTYDIDQGTLSYTVANVIRKEFTVGEGSTIVFSGDPSNPQLDVTAKYRVTANLRDLFGSDASQLATSRSNIPVLTCLHMTGTLNNPVLSFSLEFPQSDQSVQQQARQVINTDEMLMRQVIYLLVFGRFFTPDYMGNDQYATLNSTYSLLSSTVTSQINAWLSKLTNILTLGVAIRTDNLSAGSSQEYEAQFQLQPVDRLVINGNVGYRYNDISNQPFFGDLDVEVLLTEDGQLRLKGYTHTVDKYSLRQASTIQGFGLLWKRDFNWPERKKKDKSQKSKDR